MECFENNFKFGVGCPLGFINTEKLGNIPSEVWYEMGFDTTRQTPVILFSRAVVHSSCDLPVQSLMLPRNCGRGFSLDIIPTILSQRKWTVRIWAEILQFELLGSCHKMSLSSHLVQHQRL